MNAEFSIIILAAGKGTRMNNPDKPKVLAEIYGKSLIHYVLDTSISLNPSDINLIVGFKKEQVVEYVDTNFKAFQSNIKFVVQAEQLGTGHAVKQAKPNYENADIDVLILSGDVPAISAQTLKQFIDLHQNEKADLSVLSANADNPTGYGRIIRNASNDFLRITEEKDCTAEEKLIKEINSGIYFVNSKLLFDSLEMVRQNNAQAEYYLTDIIEICARQNKKVIASNIAGIEEIQGVNTVEQLEMLAKVLG